MSEASSDVLSRSDLRPSGMYENRGVSVLWCLICYFLNVGRLIRIGSLFISGMGVF